MIYGHENIQTFLSKAIEAKRMHHALLFYGPDGIGKFTTALQLIRHLNCNDPVKKPCGVCSSCKRLLHPFPFHPDLQLFRDVKTPIYLTKEHIINLFRQESGINVSNNDSKFDQEYEEILSLFTKRGIFKHCSSSRGSISPVDKIEFSDDKDITPSVIESLSDQPLGIWLAKKLHSYRTSGCYRKSIQINSVRELQKMLYLHTFEGQYKSVIMDDADKMLPAAQNSLLKILEEPPGNAVIILIVKNPEGLLSTIRSRCQLVPFQRLSKSVIEQILIEKFGYTAHQAESIALNSNGSVAQAIGTDWEMKAHQSSVFDNFFSYSDMETADWALSIANEIAEIENSDEGEGITVFYQWLHRSICDNPDKISVPDKFIGKNPFLLDTAISLLSGLDEISKNSIFHIDLKLHLETLFLTMVEKNNQEVKWVS